MGWNNFKANVQVSFGLFFDYLIFYRIGRMYMVANFLSYLESVELNVLNIAKWNENQESSLFILHKH